MPNGARKLLAFSILVGGLGLAWLLRPTGQGFGFAPSSGRLILRNAGPGSSPPGSLISEVPILPGLLANQQVPSKPSGSLSSTPSGGASGQGTSKPTPPSLPARFPYIQAEKNSGRPPANPTPSSVRRHRIVDGDSLEKLAEQYLGSAALAGYIYQANRSLLPDPQLLPIGVEIVIPAPESLQPIPFEQLQQAPLAPLTEVASGQVDFGPPASPATP